MTITVCEATTLNKFCVIITIGNYRHGILIRKTQELSKQDALYVAKKIRETTTKEYTLEQVVDYLGVELKEISCINQNINYMKVKISNL